MPTQIQVRRGTAAQWTAANPTLASGEIGVETDTGKMKFGRLTPTAWNSLIYVTDASFFGGIVTGANGGTGVANTSKTITLGGNLTTSGAHTTTLTTTGPTSVTLPTTGTLATLTGTEVLTAKTLTSPIINGTVTGTAGFGAWQSYTPTFTNFTLGNGTITRAKYCQIGKTVHLDIVISLGTTSSVSGRIGVSLPVTSAYSFTNPVTVCDLTAGAANANGVASQSSTTQIDVYALVASGTYVTRTNVSSTIPGTWASGSTFAFKYTYEAA